jgi:hypothetical protein
VESEPAADKAVLKRTKDYDARKYNKNSQREWSSIQEGRDQGVSEKGLQIIIRIYVCFS